MKKPHKKPTGSIRILGISNNGVEKIDINFPETKSEQENKIVELFLRIVPKYCPEFLFDKFEPNKEQDLDFTLTHNQEKSLLELTELTPATNMKGGYLSVSNTVDQNELVERLIKIIDKKSDNYVSINTPIDLLIYITDDNADLGLITEKYLKIYFNQNTHKFRNIFYFKPHFEINTGFIIKLYPNNETQTELPKLAFVINFKF